MGKIRFLKQAVEDRGFAVRRVDNYVWAINGHKLLFNEFIKACREIIRKYPAMDRINFNRG